MHRLPRPRRALGLLTAAALVSWLALGCSKPPAGSAEGPAAPASNDQKAAAGPTPARLGFTGDPALQISPEDTCPVCGMRPHKSPKFAGGVELEGGATFYTCGLGCLARVHLYPKVYLGADAAPIARVLVPDYFDGSPLDARTAHWVYGSDVVGPMGPAFVALRSEEDLATFRRRHGGAHTFQLGQLTPEKFSALTGKPDPRGADAP